MAKKGGFTLKEWDQKLKDAGRYDAVVDQRQRRDLERSRSIAELGEAESPLVADLVAAGFEVSSVWDLVNAASPYPQAIPVLLSHLDHDYPVRIREGIARALAVREAHSGWNRLLRAYSEAPHPEGPVSGIRYAFSLTLAAAADESNVDDLVRLAGDEANDTDRHNFVRALGRLRSPAAIAALQHFSEDPAVAKEAIAALRRKRLR